VEVVQDFKGESRLGFFVACGKQTMLKELDVMGRGIRALVVPYIPFAYTVGVDDLNKAVTGAQVRLTLCPLSKFLLLEPLNSMAV
jgi:hypothetical protein